MSTGIWWSFLIGLIFLASSNTGNEVGHTEIMNWQDGKKGAVSLTYDDGSINQFRVALPIMNRLAFPATFYIITGNIPGSKYTGKFIGRPVEEIIMETAQIPTDGNNFFERASAVSYLGFKGITRFHTQAGQLFESGRVGEAYTLMDETYKKVREGAFEPDGDEDNDQPSPNLITWGEIQTFAYQGHEFGSHTITHPRLAVLDQVNMAYELEKSKEDILDKLGPEHIFSAECPYGTEDERVMEYALKIYPALRNRMPEPFLEELNRWNIMDPGAPLKEYVQWQRGPLTDTPMELMKSWIDTLVVHENIWLVLVFHGVDGVGWEAKPREELEQYFQYIKMREDHIWVATFKDATRYIRERMNATVQTKTRNKSIKVKLTHTLDQYMYSLPLTLKTFVTPSWTTVKVKQGEKEQVFPVEHDETGAYVMYQAVPNIGVVKLSRG